MNFEELMKRLNENEYNNKKLDSIDFDKCYKNIETAVKSKRKWYSKLYAKYYKLNKKFHVKLVMQVCIVGLLIIFTPQVIKFAENEVNKYQLLDKMKNAFSNPSAKVNKNKITKFVYDGEIDHVGRKGKGKTITDTSKDVGQLTDTGKEQSSATTTNNTSFGVNESPSENLSTEARALNVVRKAAEKRFKNFTLCYDEKYYDKNYDTNTGRWVCYVALHENRTDNILPDVRMYKVDCDNFNIIDDWTQTFDEDHYLDYINTAFLINSLENYKINDVIQLSKTISESSNQEIRNMADTISKDLKLYYYKDKNIYYAYNDKNGKLYRKKQEDKTLNQIYEYNPSISSPAVIEVNTDLNNDGKSENIKFDRLRRLLTVNGTSIRILQLCDSVLTMEIRNYDGKKYIYIHDDFLPINEKADPNWKGLRQWFQYKENLITQCNVKG